MLTKESLDCPDCLSAKVVKSGRKKNGVQRYRCRTCDKQFQEEYCAQTDEILALTMGKRSKKTLKDLYKRLKDIQVNFWCTDAWKAFKEVLPKESHLIGKQFNRAIEGVNTSLRNICKRLIRRTTAFSKKIYNHWCAVKLVMYHRNLNTSCIKNTTNQASMRLH